MPSNKLPKGLTGVAGEYFVAAELSRLGYVASITLRNTKGIDILVSNATATRQIAIQVKANQGNKPEWVLNKKAESFYSDNLFYVFVNLKSPDERPDFYIVPSKVVANFVRADHQNWLETPGKSGQPHKDNPVRKFRDPKKQFLERWDLLGL
ncbi:aspartate ammonia-lyase [Candidatus Parcubacteria bacterium]|nr:MAG: aspartate ammonia-lyase [Candidatus Parcubacteria bacterium]